MGRFPFFGNGKLANVPSVPSFSQFFRPQFFAVPSFSPSEQGWGGRNQQAADGDQMIQMIMEAGSALWERKS